MAAARARAAMSLMAEAESSDDDAPAVAEAKLEEAPVSTETTSAPSASEGGGGVSASAGGETGKEMRKRHKQEMEEAEAKARGIVAAAKKKNNVTRTLAGHEADKVKEEVRQRHEQELASLPPGERGDDDDHDDDKEGETLDAGVAAMGIGGGGFQMQQGKKSKAQKKREAKLAEEEARYREAKESMKGWEDPKVREEEQIKARLEPLGLKVEPIQADGHCLYRALADQCKRSDDDDLFQWGGPEGYTKLRKCAGAYMRSHPDDFAPFVVAEDDSGSSDPFADYIAKVEETAEWGGHLEITALARALPANIHVHSAEQSEQVFSPDNPCGVHLLVSYHRHAFGLGEHYNSVHKA